MPVISPSDLLIGASVMSMRISRPSFVSWESSSVVT
jgi:hypothetical protein